MSWNLRDQIKYPKVKIKLSTIFPINELPNSPKDLSLLKIFNMLTQFEYSLKKFPNQRWNHSQLEVSNVKTFPSRILPKHFKNFQEFLPKSKHSIYGLNLSWDFGNLPMSKDPRPMLNNLCLKTKFSTIPKTPTNSPSVWHGLDLFSERSGLHWSNKEKRHSAKYSPNFFKQGPNHVEKISIWLRYCLNFFSQGLDHIGKKHCVHQVWNIYAKVQTTLPKSSPKCT